MDINVRNDVSYKLPLFKKNCKKKEGVKGNANPLKKKG